MVWCVTEMSSRGIGGSGSDVEAGGGTPSLQGAEGAAPVGEASELAAVLQEDHLDYAAHRQAVVSMNIGASSKLVDLVISGRFRGL